jgi:hypothetical protein
LTIFQYFQTFFPAKIIIFGIKDNPNKDIYELRQPLKKYKNESKMIPSLDLAEKNFTNSVTFSAMLQTWLS